MLFARIHRVFLKLARHANYDIDSETRRVAGFLEDLADIEVERKPRTRALPIEEVYHEHRLMFECLTATQLRSSQFKLLLRELRDNEEVPEHLRERIRKLIVGEPEA